MGQIAGKNDQEVFVRGYGGEIIRGFYSRQNKKMTGDLVKDFYMLYKTQRVKEPSEVFHSFLLDATEG